MKKKNYNQYYPGEEWSKAKRINAIVHSDRTLKRMLDDLGEERKSHTMDDVVDSEYTLVKTSHGVVVLETPDAARNLE